MQSINDYCYSNGYEKLMPGVSTIAEQRVHSGCGYRVGNYCYIEIPSWGLLRYEYNANGHVYCDGYVPFAGF